MLNPNPRGSKATMSYRSRNAAGMAENPDTNGSICSIGPPRLTNIVPSRRAGLAVARCLIRARLILLPPGRR